MTSPLLPRTVSIPTAATLAGHSPNHIREWIEDGILHAEPTGVLTSRLEQLIGHDITPAAYLAALRRQDGRREADRHRKHRFVAGRQGGRECVS
jgi:hypothetical protein